MELKKKKVHENLDLNPISLYNKVKMVTERVLLSYNKSIDINIVRPELYVDILLE